MSDGDTEDEGGGPLPRWHCERDPQRTASGSLRCSWVLSQLHDPCALLASGSQRGGRDGAAGQREAGTVLPHQGASAATLSGSQADFKEDDQAW